MGDDRKKMLTAQEASRRLGVTPRAIAKWVQQGIFPGAYKVNPLGISSPYRIPIEDIEAFEALRKKRASDE